MRKTVFKTLFVTLLAVIVLISAVVAVHTISAAVTFTGAAPTQIMQKNAQGPDLVWESDEYKIYSPGDTYQSVTFTSYMKALFSSAVSKPVKAADCKEIGTGKFTGKAFYFKNSDGTEKTNLAARAEMQIKRLAHRIATPGVQIGMPINPLEKADGAVKVKMPVRIIIVIVLLAAVFTVPAVLAVRRKKAGLCKPIKKWVKITLISVSAVIVAAAIGGSIAYNYFLSDLPYEIVQEYPSGKICSTMYKADKYVIVKWNKTADGKQYEKTRVYYTDGDKADFDTLWKKETETSAYKKLAK